MWKSIALFALGIVRKKLRLDGATSELWDKFMAFLRSL